MNTRIARFSPEMRERAVRLIQECQTDYASLWSACESIALASTKSGAIRSHSAGQMTSGKCSKTGLANR